MSSRNHGGLSRRSLLRAGGAAALAAAALGREARPAGAGQFTGKLRKAIRWNMITENLSVMDKFKMLKDLGFEGVEPTTPAAVQERKAMRQAVDATGVAVHGLSNGASADIVTAVELTKELGGDSVLVVVAAAKSNESYLTNYKKTQDNIRRAVASAEKTGVRILVENVWASWLNEPMSMARYIDEIGSPMVGSYFDIGNNVCWGLPEHWIEVLGKRIGKIHIKDCDRKKQMDEGLRKGMEAEIGEGSVDWKRVRQELEKIAYTGWATAEVKGGDRSRLADISRRMDKVMDL